MPTFDPAQYLDMETDQAATKRPPLDPADYTSLIGNVEMVQWTKNEKSGLSLKVPHQIQLTPEVKAKLGITQDFIVLTDRVFIDLNEQGMMDWAPGRNGGLRRYREALGQNIPGEPWSPRRMIGRPCVVKIKHGLFNGEVTEEIDGVAKAG